ncbi:hypothetical protein [Magnetospirillum sp. UT-4]|uniref:hypothetical protein n=1 Tax=Magnetospirillum sp. UT-4 TaxID=2681467 RepID=UPI0020C1DEE1|nr:hypothetical protein [Magnetospirillum sp. UT-4]
MFGRFLGWFLIALTVVMASADAVLALGPADYSGIVTADLLTLLTGGAPDGTDVAPSLLATASGMLLDLPAWVMVGLAGTAMVVAFRKRNKRFRFRRTGGTF